MEISGLQDHNFADQYPCRLPVWWARHGDVGKDPQVRGVSGRTITIRIEKKFKRFEKFMARILRAPKELRRPLDTMNSMLWELCDGSRTFAEVCQIMNDVFQEDISPVVTRTAQALGLLQYHQLVLMLEEPLDGRWSVRPGLIPNNQQLSILKEGHVYDVTPLPGEMP